MEARADFSGSATSPGHPGHHFRQESSAAASYKEIGATVSEMESSLAGYDDSGFTEACGKLITQANEARRQALLATDLTLVRDNTRPLAITKRLFKLLASDEMGMILPLQREIAKVARLFADLAFLKGWQNNVGIRIGSKDELLSQIKELRRDIPETEVGLRHELKCAKASLEMLWSEKNIWGPYCESLLKLLVLQDVAEGIDQIKRLRKEIKPDISWITQAQYIFLFGSQWKSDVTMFEDLRAYIKPYTEEPNIALTAVNTLAGLIWSGSEEIQEAALSGEPSLLTLATKETSIPRLRDKLWPVRYQAILHLHALLKHPSPRVRKLVEDKLVERTGSKGERDKRVRKLFDDPKFLEGMGSIFDRAKDNFEQAAPQELDELAALREQLIEKEAQLRAKEDDLASLRIDWECDREEKNRAIESQRQEIAGKEDELRRQRKELEELTKRADEAAQISTEEYRKLSVDLIQKQSRVRRLEVDVDLLRPALNQEIEKLARAEAQFRQLEMKITEERNSWRREKQDFRRREHDYEEAIRRFEEMEQHFSSASAPKEEKSVPSQPASPWMEEVDWGRIKKVKEINAGQSMNRIAQLSSGQFVTANQAHFSLWDTDWNLLKTVAHTTDGTSVSAIIPCSEGMFRLHGAPKSTLWNSEGLLVKTLEYGSGYSSSFPLFAWPLSSQYHMLSARGILQIIDTQNQKVISFASGFPWSQLYPLQGGGLTIIGHNGEVAVWKAPSKKEELDVEKASLEKEVHETKGIDWNQIPKEKVINLSVHAGLKANLYNLDQAKLVTDIDGYYICRKSWK